MSGRIPTPTNPTSPAVAGSQLLLLDQAGALYRWDGSAATPLITLKTVPAGVKPMAPEPLMSVAADKSGSKVYVMFLSATMPRDLPRRMSPREPDSWYLLYEYQFDGTTLSAPRPVTAMQARREGHLAGGMTVLDDGSVLFSVGDNGDSYEDGRDNGQNPAIHLAKIIRINPADGSTAGRRPGRARGAATAVYTIAGEPWVTFVEPGGWISEELNAARQSDLLIGHASAQLRLGAEPG